MTMANMAITPEEVQENGLSNPEAPAYPYGLCLQLDEDQLALLGIKGLPAVGVTLMLCAKATIQSASTYQSMDGEQEMSVSLQITDMEVMSPLDGMSAAKALFGASES